MAHYGSGSPKRQKCFSNNRTTGVLNMGKLKKEQREKLTAKTTKRTKGGGFQGTAALKESQRHGCAMKKIKRYYVLIPRPNSLNWMGICAAPPKTLLEPSLKGKPSYYMGPTCVLKGFYPPNKKTIMLDETNSSPLSTIYIGCYGETTQDLASSHGWWWDELYKQMSTACMVFVYHGKYLMDPKDFLACSKCWPTWKGRWYASYISIVSCLGICVSFSHCSLYFHTELLGRKTLRQLVRIIPWCSIYIYISQTMAGLWRMSRSFNIYTLFAK